MRKIEKHSIKLTDGFPNYLRGFSNGPLSLCVERFGGWAGIRCIRTEYDSYNFPISDQESVQLFGKDNNKESNRPLLCPAIRFLAEDKDGCAFPFQPQTGLLTPTGFQSRCDFDGFKGKYDLLLGKDNASASFEWKGRSPTSFVMAFAKAHFNTQPEDSSFNQIIGDAAACLSEELTSGLAPEKPFPTGAVRPTPLGFRFDPARNAFLFRIELEYPTWKRTIYAVLTAVSKLSFKETSNQWIFSMNNKEERGRIRIALAFSENDSDSAYAHATAAIRNFAENMRHEKATVRKIAATVPSFDIEGVSEAGTFFRIAPHYQNSLIVHEDSSFASIRSGSWRYGACVTWDHTLPIRDFLFFGQRSLARKLLAYQAAYPYIECSLCTTPMFISQLGEYAAFTQDWEFVEALTPRLETFMSYADRMTEPKTGLVKFSRSLGVDIVTELNLTPPFFAPEINGIFFDSFRVLENIYLRLGKENIASEAGKRADMIEKNFLTKFYSPKEGYLVCGLNQDYSVPTGGPVFMNVATMPMHYSYGEYLFRKVLVKLADYQANKLYHPGGRVSLAYDSKGCNGMRSVHMNQHLLHLCRIARTAGKTDEAYRVMAGTLKEFVKYGTAIEIFNNFGCEGDPHLRSSWQAFASTGAYGSAIASMAGINWHGGGIYYMPGDDPRRIRLGKFKFGEHIFDFEITGRGAYVDKMLLNGTLFEGSLQLPENLPARAVRCNIVRSSKPFVRPMLMSATGLGISVVESSGERLVIRAGNDARACIKLFSPSKPSITLNGEKVPLEWHAGRSTVWLDRRFKTGDELEARL